MAAETTVVFVGLFCSGGVVVARRMPAQACGQRLAHPASQVLNLVPQHVIGGAGFHGGHRQLLARRARHEDDGHIEAGLLHVLAARAAGPARQEAIGEDQIRCRFQGGPKGVFRVHVITIRCEIGFGEEPVTAVPDHRSMIGPTKRGGDQACAQHLGAERALGTMDSCAGGKSDITMMQRTCRPGGVLNQPEKL